MSPQEINNALGNIDLYLLDAILKGYIPAGSKVLDAGCGEGRNLHWFLRNDFEVWGLDQNAAAIRMLRFVANSARKDYPQDRFVTGQVEAMPYASDTFDTVICSAVLHFAENEKHLKLMWAELWRVLKPGGFLFVRTATTHGLALNELQADANGRMLLHDGSLRFLLSDDLLKDLLSQYPMEWLEPQKSVLVLNQRSMGVLMLSKTIL